MARMVENTRFTELEAVPFSVSRYLHTPPFDSS